jgi:hypothetical protein
VPADDGMGSLIASLGGCVDHLRDIEVCLGQRTTRVFLVWTRWSEGVRGEGHEQVIREVELLPLPEVGPVKSLDISVQNIGSAELGTTEIRKISPRFTENFLMGRAQDGTPIAQDQNFYWETVTPDGSLHPPRRRWFPKSPPTRDDDDFQWVIRLVKVSENRTAQREVRG